MSTPYTVRSGDTLSAIARRNGYATWQEIYNHPENADFRRRRPNPNLIYPGDELMLPDRGGVTPPGPTPPGPTPPAPPPTPGGEFRGFTDTQRDLILADLERARKMLDAVVRKLRGTQILPGPIVADTRAKVAAIFHIDPLDPNAENPIGDAFQWTQLLENYAILRRSLDETFDKVFEPDHQLFAAWVVGTTDPTVHFSPVYFEADRHPDDRAATLIHERSHTVLKMPGHPGSGDSIICVVPHEGIRIPVVTQAEAMKNAYCYELLALALQPDYSPARFRDNPLCQNPPP